ncbi:transposase [Candidatus Bipolaricaulota bacterium]
MPRAARGLVDDAVYHVLNRGNAKQTMFFNSADYDAFLRLLRSAKGRYPIRLLAYCLMPNHFHFVVQPVHGGDLSKCMHWLLTSHARRYHNQRGTSGHVWQGRYKSFLIKEDNHLLMAMRYVERNPVRAGLVMNAIDWPWSSHRESGGTKTRDLLDDCPIHLPQGWSSYVDMPLIESELARLRRSVHRQSPYG